MILLPYRLTDEICSAWADSFVLMFSRYYPLHPWISVTNDDSFPSFHPFPTQLIYLAREQNKNKSWLANQGCQKWQISFSYPPWSCVRAVSVYLSGACLIRKQNGVTSVFFCHQYRTLTQRKPQEGCAGIDFFLYVESRQNIHLPHLVKHFTFLFIVNISKPVSLDGYKSEDMTSKTTYLLLLVVFVLFFYLKLFKSFTDLSLVTAPLPSVQLCGCLPCTHFQDDSATQD